MNKNRELNKSKYFVNLYSTCVNNLKSLAILNLEYVVSKTIWHTVQCTSRTKKRVKRNEINSNIPGYGTGRSIKRTREG